MDDVCRHIGQRHQHEPADVQARVRNLQGFRMDDPVAIEQKVQVQRAGIPADNTLALVGVLDRMATREQVLGGERCLDFQDRIQEPPLAIRPANGGGLVQARGLERVDRLVGNEVAIGAS